MKLTVFEEILLASVLPLIFLYMQTMRGIAGTTEDHLYTLLLICIGELGLGIIMNNSEKKKSITVEQ